MAHVAVTFVAYLLFGGWKLFARIARAMAPRPPWPSRSTPGTG